MANQAFSVLVISGRTIVEAIIIIEHLQLYHPGPMRLIPDDAKKALDVRMMDRFFDNYVMTPMQTIVFDKIRQESDRDPYGVTQARAMLDTAYRWLDGALEGREWAAGDTFSAAIAPPPLPSSMPIGPIPSARSSHGSTPIVNGAARPSFARAVNEARPYRHFFPLGAPNRD